MELNDSPLENPTPLGAEILRLKRELKACRGRCERREKELGQFLHDGACQELSAATFYLQCLKNQWETGEFDRMPQLMEQLSASLRKSVEATHTLSQRLRGGP
jgi:signal transduction histidine kinase